MSSHSEVKGGDDILKEITPATYKLDSTGLPLIPQPTASPFDPLNYPNVKPPLVPVSSLLTVQLSPSG